MSIFDNLAKALIQRSDASRFDQDYVESAWQNLATGIGSSTDRMSYQLMSGVATLQARTLSQLMLSDWIARRIVGANPYEAFRLGVQVSYDGDVDSDNDLVRTVQQECDALGVWRKCWMASTFGRGYGGALIHVVTDDGKVEEPLNYDRVSRIFSLDVYDPNEVVPMSLTTWDPYDMERPKDWLWPDHEYYIVNSKFTHIPHLDPSRVICFGGLLTSRSERWEYFRGWDASVLQPVWDQLREFQGSNQSITRMMQTASQAVLKIPRLWDLIVKGGKERLRSRLQAATLASHVGNVVPINDDEEMSFVERSFAGIKDLGEFELLLVAGAAEMPATVLFGRSPAGLSATGESDREAWYSSVEARRIQDYGPPMIQIVQLVAKTMGARDPEGWGIAWPSLWRLSPLQQVELEERQVMTDDARIAQGIPAETLLRHRYGGKEYRLDPPMLTEEDFEHVLAESGLIEPTDEPVIKPEVAEPAEPIEAVSPDTALNGAQVTALLEVVQQVVSGILPRESAVEIIVSAFPVDRAIAERILGDVGRTFKPEPIDLKPEEE